ncbi:hypothetical protein EZS27_011366 [termite gut metagenome]|uniref:Uncharacterized protein n=1 Tax=termite gut metagenome TaxID=433724 RepID=A0A5J4S3Z7_9ZZZZ
MGAGFFCLSVIPFIISNNLYSMHANPALPSCYKSKRKNNMHT